MAEGVRKVTTLPTTLAVVLTLAPVVVALAAIGADSLRERGRQKHERAMRVREDQMRAYSTMARLSKVIQPGAREQIADLVEVLSEIELLTNNPRLLSTAGKVVAAAGSTILAAGRHQEGSASQTEVESVQDELTAHRKEFIRLAKEELA